jgi:hypothetical protein
MILPINPPKEVVIVAAKSAETIEANELSIITISDNTIDSVTAVVNVQGYNKVLILWEGQAYINIGNWTQDQANARILELV